MGCWAGGMPFDLRLTVKLALVSGHVEGGVPVLDPLVDGAAAAAQFGEHARNCDVALLASDVKGSSPVILSRVHGGTAPCEVPSYVGVNGG